MKKIFIYLSLFTILLMAFSDAKDRLSALQRSPNSGTSTPAQFQMNEHINTRPIKSDTVNFTSSPNKFDNRNNLREKTRQDLQNSINEMNERQKQNSR